MGVAVDEEVDARPSQATSTSDLDWDLDAEVFAAFDLAASTWSRPIDRIEIDRLSADARTLFTRVDAPRAPLSPIEVHRRISVGLPGFAILIAGALALENLAEVSGHFRVTPKTLRARAAAAKLSASDSELAVRTVRVWLMARKVLGDADSARRYLRTRNFALGGATPLELVQTSEGERLVLDELQAHADSGPL